MCIICSVIGRMCGMPSRVLLRWISGKQQCQCVWSSLSHTVPQGTLLPARYDTEVQHCVSNNGDTCGFTLVV